jgi:hypothetical protein
MTKRVSTMVVRARIGDMLNRVALRHGEFIIERKGKAAAALVPVVRLEQMRRFVVSPATVAEAALKLPKIRKHLRVPR